MSSPRVPSGDPQPIKAIEFNLYKRKQEAYYDYHLFSNRKRTNMAYYVYILSSKKNGTLYIGVTGSLSNRIIEHKESLTPGFTQRYHVTRLMYFEEYTYIQDAIAREKQLKKWNRAWKIRLIEKSNPEWKDLFNDL